MAGDSRYFLPDDRQCLVCVPHRNHERNIYERICPLRKNRKFYPYDDQQSGRYPVYCIRLVRYGILCQPTQFRRQHIGRFIDAGIACSTHHHSHNRRDVQRYPVLFQRRQYGLRGNQSTDHLESPASYGHSPDHYGTHTLAGTCLGRDSTYLVHLRSILLPKLPTSIFDQCMALPYHLYVVATSGTDVEAQQPIAYGTAFVLIVIVLIMNLAANGIRNYFDKKSS